MRRTPASRRWPRHPSSLLARLRGRRRRIRARPRRRRRRPAGAELTGELTVYAAASLKAAFDELATQFEARHPSLEVLPIVYDGSSTLATQLIEGAPADVFASADENEHAEGRRRRSRDRPASCSRRTRSSLVDAGRQPGRRRGPRAISPTTASPWCCARPRCRAARHPQTLLSNAGLTVTPASLEQNVTAVLTKVAAGEADAGLVYATDVLGRDRRRVARARRAPPTSSTATRSPR